MSLSGESTLFASRGSEGVGEVLDSKLGDQSLNVHNKSPYTDTSIVTLDVGPTKTRFQVHSTILSQSTSLAAKVVPSQKLWGADNTGRTTTDIVLPDLDEVTAHSLIHYLYTGRYQTLDSSPTTEKAEKAATANYKLSTCIYCAAITFKLPGLAELAQEHITALGAELTIFDILSVTRDHAFPILPDDETWFPSYLEGAIKSAYFQDPGLFTKPGFVDLIEGDRKFRQVVMKAIVNTYSTAGSAGASTPAISQVGRESSVPEDQIVEEPPVLAKPVDEAAPAQPAEKDVAALLPDIEPDVPSPLHRPATPLFPSPPPPESVTDELDFKASKTYQSMNATSSASASANIRASDVVVIPDGTTKQAEHTRNDSAVQVETALAELEKLEEVASQAVAPALSKKKKEKKSKKKKNSRMEEEETEKAKKKAAAEAVAAGGGE